jgi:flagellar hook-associated protein 3 FlgL
MSLRITQSHLFAQARRDVHRGLLRYQDLQHAVATGRRVNKPSDDPAAMLRILPLTRDIRGLAQMGENVSLARETLDTGTVALEDASALMQRVRELVMQAANGTTSDSGRRAIGTEVDALLGQLLSLGNSRRGDRYLFGGTASDRVPFELVTDAGGTRVLYRGNHDTLSVEVAPGVETELNVAGDSIFLRRDRGATSFSRLEGQPATGARPTGSGDTGTGFQQLTVGFAGLAGAPPQVTAGAGGSTALGALAFTFTAVPPSLSIGGGPPVTIPATDTDFTTADGRKLNLTVTGVPAVLTGTLTSLASLSTDGGATRTVVPDFAATAVAVRNSFDGTVLNVDVRTLARTGAEQVEFAGTFDAFTTLVTLRDLLADGNGLGTGEVQARLTRMLAAVDGAHDAVLDGVRELGFRSSSMQALANRVSGLAVSRQESLSLVQDTDIAQAIMELQRQDLSYQAALQVSARAMQISLQNYLR